MVEISSSAGPSPDGSCPRCGVTRESGTGGLCPRCLLAMNLRTMTLPGSVSGSDRDRMPPPSLEEMSGRFPQFEFLEYLGRGGMGIVYKARQKALDRLVAIKILAGEWQHEPGFAERFVREAKTLAKLAHSHIVTVHDFGEQDGLYYLVMEYVDGVNLRDLLRDGKLEPQQALAIVPPVCEALQYAHSHGVIHRDIKPENLLLDREGRIKIADFGIAAMAGELPDHSGTPAYMSPEQSARTARPTDHLTDIYSLGAVLYEMLTGRLPPASEALSAQSITIDVRIDEIVLRALASKPEARYQSASEMGQVVRTVAATFSSSPRAPSPPFVPTIARVPESQSLLHPEAMGLIFLLLGVSAIFWWLLFTNGDTDQSVKAFLLMGGLALGVMATIAGKIGFDRILKHGGSERRRVLATLDILVTPLGVLVVILSQVYLSLLNWASRLAASWHREEVESFLNTNRSGIAILAVGLTALWLGLRMARALSRQLERAGSPVSPPIVKPLKRGGGLARAGLIVFLVSLYLLKALRFELLPERPGPIFDRDAFGDGSDPVWMISIATHLLLRSVFLGVAALLGIASMAFGFASLKSSRLGDQSPAIRFLALGDMLGFPLLMLTHVIWLSALALSKTATGAYQPEMCAGVTILVVSLAGWQASRPIMKITPGANEKRQRTAPLPSS